MSVFRRLRRRDWRATSVRLGVVACITCALATAAAKLDDVIGVFDVRADRNSALTYAERSHTHSEWVPAAGRVLEAARLWMPPDARYRLVLGPTFLRKTDFTHLFLTGFLLPRRPTRSPTAEWLICYACPDGFPGRRFRVLAATEGGPVLARRLP